MFTITSAKLTPEIYLARGGTLNMTRQQVVTNSHKVQFKLTFCDHQEHFENLISQEAMFFKLSNAEKK